MDHFFDRYASATEIALRVRYGSEGKEYAPGNKVDFRAVAEKRDFTVEETRVKNQLVKLVAMLQKKGSGARIRC